ncbi:acyl-CoA synthetase (AMP-forming)/AMP-acid ligase II [Edaphobacter aggregans]|uniref:Long-chain-fatty-acid--CoA ligase n=1 Tax=Edaphobacter aggregans TaxID=570835 RepID=A0A3R9QIK6_9BACT|nr:fatty acid--CoA ligase family protein [Edaphobacter aggregans]RSL17396.1 acyl-CoA synthetase (AMP-forming)/AMP-acid ligase II [Edaphobacter aggregans]
MTMQQGKWASLWNALSAAGDLSGRFVFGAEASIALSDLLAGSALYGRGDELGGRSVLVTTTNQFTTASALIELDGIARRMVLCPPDLPVEHLPYVIESANVDAIVSDRTILGLDIHRPLCFCPCTRKIVPENCSRSAQYQTEWILLTSGTTGLPKLVVHTLSSLSGAIKAGSGSAEPTVWSTFYDIRRYGGLQIFLRAFLTGTSLVLSSAEESTADFLARAGSHGVTHISGTPCQWRRALMSPSANLIQPKYIRLSGEIADQAILNHLRSFYPQARIAHAFASTEAGVAFEVNDGIAGFPASAIEDTPDVEMKVEDRSLWIRSNRTASRYLGDQPPILKNADGFVDTRDLIELRDDRYYFVGRQDGAINVGGLKVYPEEVEAVINRHPEVQMSLVRTKRNPITGALVVADVVLTEQQSASRDMRALQGDILLLCRETLSSHKVPVAINFIPALAVTESGKLVRRNA